MPAIMTTTWARDLVPQAQWRLIFDGPASPTIQQMDDLGQLMIDTYVASDMRASCISNTWTLPNVTVADLADTTRFASPSVGASGQAGIDALPAYCTLAVRLRTGSGTNNGRVFQPGFAEVVSTNSGRPDLQRVGFVLDFFRDLWNDARVLGPGWDLAVRQGSGVLAPVTAIDRSPSSATLGWQNQRRRRRPLR